MIDAVLSHLLQDEDVSKSLKAKVKEAINSVQLKKSLQNEIAKEVSSQIKLWVESIMEDSDEIHKIIESALQSKIREAMKNL